MNRPSGAPPALPGFTFVQRLGSGGFSDVYEYEQLGLGRRVAVKVLFTDIDADVHASFAVEANVMAQLSNHPSIVSIYQAGTTGDGRPFLVMEYCPPPHLAVRLRTRPLSVGKALEVVVQLCGAVETAHRLGILHRDIKPANILFTEFGRAALTDFGISVTTSRAGAGEGIGVSVPWAPPEQLTVGAPMGPSSDVYSIAATLWAALVGHSPFHAPGGANDSVSLSARVRGMPLPPTRRHDVPESLERALRTAMAKRPDERYDTALAFARALQGIQAELHEPVTTVDVLDEHVAETVEEEGAGGTRVSGFVSIDPDAASARPSRQPSRLSNRPSSRRTGPSTGPSAGPSTGPTPEGSAGPRLPPPSPEHDGTRLRMRPGELADIGVADRGGPGRADRDEVGDSGPQVLLRGAVGDSRDGRRSSAFVVALVAVLAVVGFAVWLGVRAPGGTDQPDAPETTPRAVDPVGPAGPLPPASVEVERDTDRLTVTWENPDPQPGDTYLLHLQADPGAVSLDPENAIEATETSAVVPTDGEACVTVRTVRGSRQSEPVLKCDLT